MLSKLQTILFSKAKDARNDERGFSLIELLVVVLIIGILAAIAIPIFLGQQDQAKDAAAKSDLGNAKIALISYATDNAGSYDGATATTIADYGYTASDGVTDFAIAITGSNFCIEAKSAAGNFFHVTDSTGVAPDACP